MKCDTCNGTGEVAERAPNEYRQVPEGFGNLCFILSKNEACKPEWLEFMNKIRGYDTISEKQYKFFAVIHKECLGSWPPIYFKALPRPGEPKPKPVHSLGGDQPVDEEFNVF